MSPSARYSCGREDKERTDDIIATVNRQKTTLATGDDDLHEPASHVAIPVKVNDAIRTASKCGPSYISPSAENTPRVG